MTEKLGKEEIAGYECRHVVYQRPPAPGEPDMHVVKEIIHTRDGRQVPHVRIWKDFQREFYVTKDAERKHEQKKEWESVDKLRVFKSRQCDLIRNAAKALGTPWIQGGLRKIAQSPYLYGADILSTAVLKHNYQAKFPELNTPFISAPFDIESDVVHGTGDPIMIAFAYQNQVYTVVDKKFVEGYTNVEMRLRSLLEEKLGDIVKKRNITWHLEFTDGTVDCIKKTFAHIHHHKPDFVSIWNMDFDIPRVAETLEKYGESPAEVFSDPAVPDGYKDFFYKRGPSQKVTASGKVMPIKPSGRWHTVYTPASYYVIDAMCAYRHIRNQQAEEQSYSLDAILNKEIKRGKLTFPNITTVTEGTLEWHQEMQSKHPLEYIIYNFFDVVGMQELDDKIQDLALTLPMFSGCSDFSNFKSQPRRMVDDLHYYCLDYRGEDAPNGLVIATTSDQMRDKYDDLTVDTDGWIITLPAHLVIDNGLQIIEHAPWLRTNFRGHTGDLDVSASYPTNEEVMNISKETTHRELVSIEGVALHEQKMCGINLSGGQTNSVEIATTLFGLPTLDELLNDFRASRLH
ncbi:MAG: hypothetical protein P4L77_10870 [Sulfuriferula sp.]|nr:hypothetical protein [Sulfuriferula sp.]